MYKHEVKNLPYLLRYVPDQYDFKQMCDKAILENENNKTLKYFPYCYKCIVTQLIITPIR